MLTIRIQVKGRIDQHWSEAFAGLTITHLNNEYSVLSGKATDQAELYDVLSRLWDYRLELISVDVSAGSNGTDCTE